MIKAIPKVGIVDYGSGNIAALEQALKCISVESVVLANKSDIKNANYSHLILPGVGRFDMSMGILHKNELVDSIKQVARSGKCPILGICLGMHLMADFSFEGECEGLSLIPGEVKSLDTINIYPTPHMGWNRVFLNSFYENTNNKFANLFSESKYFYFIHSFYFEVNSDINCLAKVNYLKDFPVVVFKENILGVQFHPEKSHSSGLKLIKNFSDLQC